MSLKEQIQSDIKTALMEGKEVELSALRMLLSAIVNKEKEKRFKISKEKQEIKSEELQKESRLVDEEVIEVVSSEIKKRKEAKVLFEKGGRQELAQREEKESEVLKKYLPEQLSEEDIKKIVQDILEKTGAKGVKDMGKVMAQLMPKTKGKVDGQEASRIVKELLG